MYIRINLFVEIKEENNWVTYKDRPFPFTQELEDEIKSIKKNDMKLYEAVMSGHLARLNKKLNELSEQERFIQPREDLYAFSMLSGIGNAGIFRPYKTGGMRKDGWPEDIAKHSLAAEDINASYYTCYYGNEIEDLYQYIQELDDDRLASNIVVKKSTKRFVEIYFRNAVELLKQKGYQPSEIRFLISYQLEQDPKVKRTI